MEAFESKIKYNVGEIYDFTVNSIHYDFCELIDDSGFHVYLQHTRGVDLSKGQKIRCRVTANYQKRPKIELVKDDDENETESQISAETVNNIIGSTERNWDTDGFTSLLLMKEVEDTSFENECRSYIDKLKKDGTDLKEVEKDCTAFMEDSDFLSLCNPTEREHYQQRLTQIIDLIGYYTKADELLKDGTANDYTSQLLDKLERTGYVYHPDENFNVLSILFLSDKSLMEESIPRLFDIIRKWPQPIWEKEPFRTVLLKTLSLYVDENMLTVGSAGDSGKLVRNLIQALGILYVIADNKNNADTQLPDEREILSRLCVLSTYQDQYGDKELLSLAAYELFSESYYRPTFTLADTEDQNIPFDLKKRAAQLTAWPVRSSNCFIAGRQRLTVSNDGIAIWSDSRKAKSVLPDKLNLWGNLQVYANRSMMPSVQGSPTVNDCKHLWEAIGQELLVPEKADDRQDSPRQRKPLQGVHDRGDTVNITITSVSSVIENANNDNRAYCTIEGEDRESGYIYGKDIVPYMHHMDMWMFTMNDRPLVFEAKIIDVDNDGEFHFSMLDGIKEFVCEQFGYGDEIICSLGSDRRASSGDRFSPAISEDGFSISLNGSIGENLSRGDIVKAVYLGKATGSYHILCSVKERFDGHPVDLARAFHNLLMDYAIGGNDDDNDEDEQHENIALDIENTDRVIDASYVKEIIRIIDRMAAIDADYVRSYNYIAFCRMLCLMTGWKARAEYYHGRLQLIEMLYNFAINDKVDASQLDKLKANDADLFGNDAKMHEKFVQLRIISFMDGQLHDEELMKFRNTTQGILRQTASLAIAYNILLENNMKQQANDVLNNVKRMLQLNGYESHLKMYGREVESRKVEYKSSIVYPANSMQPDINRQMFVILKEIASFLNADGGVLYIGTNDSGAGIGVYDDLCYGEFNGDKDKYQRYVLDAVALKWGNLVASHVNTEWDHDETSGKDVLIVTVEPYARGVSLDGEWYYRNGSCVRGLPKEEFDEYNSHRQIRLMKAGQSHAATLPATMTAAEALQDNAEAHDNTVTAKPVAQIEKVKTSCRRKNVNFNYEDGFVQYAACLKFMPHGKVEKTTEDIYDTDGTELVLPIYDEDERDGFLILGYDNGLIGKVPVREIMKFEDHREYNRYMGAKLIFAAIACNEDGVISVSEEDKKDHRTMVRVDTISNIDKCRLSDKGNRVCNEGLASRTIAYEIAPADGLPAVKNMLDKDVRSLGFPLVTITPDLKEKLGEWGIR